MNTFLMVFFLVVSVVIQTSMLPAFGIERAVSLPMVLVVLIAILRPGSTSRWLAFAAGVLVSVFAVAQSGIVILVFTGVGLLTEVLFLRFFTNRSIYAVIVLMIIATCAQSVFFLVANLLFQAEMTWSGFVGMWQQLIGNAAAAIVLFYTVVYAVRFLQRFFFWPAYRAV